MPVKSSDEQYREENAQVLPLRPQSWYDWLEATRYSSCVPLRPCRLRLIALPAGALSILDAYRSCVENESRGILVSGW